ncbi:amino acid ABC transporter permease [Nocardioides sp. zg-536]|uniref:Amino acid ABC transporter permease n=1 Tax=Nocardioides faecalis TaxID=2803858 RepID=A0A938YB80_9ACTN|nr:amino acid ABC transporter permease [Nocardioides faecalis]MBM9461453.1 amino acid ABC transporter permease [Nocardioides faecalis]MBS4751781.1 amino acid ABC transporter permease [Nocardioides faecalis]QVI59359.1 amino acid ABC transporter permease [Nocardioides faecalis]
MAGSVLYDAPGPKTVARHRLYSILTVAGLLAAAAGIYLFLDSEGELTYDKWEQFVTPKFVEALLVDGLLKTLQMAFSAIILAVVFGVVFGVGKLSDHRPVRWAASLVVEFFRAVPVLLLMIFVFFTWGVGGGFGAYWSVVIALTLYNGAVLAEVFRAGILAVPKGQAEAAYAIGMRKTQVMTLVLFPQAVKIMLPAIISQCVVALKDTSLGYYITAPGLTAVGKAMWTEFSGTHFQTAVVLSVLYIGVNLVLTALATWIQKRFVGERRIDVVTAAAGMDAQTGRI